jgi:hypothetical protein
MKNTKHIMNALKFTCLALLISTTPLLAREEPFRTDINPALLYYRAFEIAPQPMSDADEAYLSAMEGSSQKIEERFGPILAGYDNEFKLVRQAALQRPPCDWGVDLSAGPETLLPHLAPAKKVAKAARWRVMWDLQNGREAAARDDLLAAMALCRNLATSTNDTLIALLVEFAMANIIDNTLAENFGRFSPETLKSLADGFDALPPRTTEANEVMGETELHSKWLSNKIQELRQQHPGDDAAVMEGLRKLFSAFAEWNWEAFTYAAGGSSEGVLNMAAGDVPLHARTAAIMALPHGEYEKQLAQFETEVHKSGNFFFEHSFPPWRHSRVKEFNMQAMQAMVRAAVAYKLHGQSGLQSVMDPLGNGPFVFQRFVLQGVDRGFELQSAYTGQAYPCALIFVEKPGVSFATSGTNIGQVIYWEMGSPGKTMKRPNP